MTDTTKLKCDECSAVFDLKAEGGSLERPRSIEDGRLLNLATLCGACSTSARDFMARFHIAELLIKDTGFTLEI